MTDFAPGAPDLLGEAEPVPVMDHRAAAQLYASPHVHDPEGRCIRNRLKSHCSAPPAPRKDAR